MPHFLLTPVISSSNNDILACVLYIVSLRTLRFAGRYQNAWSLPCSWLSILIVTFALSRIVKFHDLVPVVLGSCDSLCDIPGFNLLWSALTKNKFLSHCLKRRAPCRYLEYSISWYIFRAWRMSLSDISHILALLGYLPQLCVKAVLVPALHLVRVAYIHLQESARQC